MGMFLNPWGFASRRSYFPPAFLSDGRIRLYHGIVEGPARNSAHAIQTGEDVWSVAGVWGILPQCGPELPAKSMEGIGIQLTKMDLIPVDC